MKQVVHKPHQTAGSRRQEDMPLLYLDGNGNVIGRNQSGTRKRACYIWVPDETEFFALCYTSNSGIRTVYIYDLEFEFQKRAVLTAPDPILIDWEYEESLPTDIPIFNDAGEPVKELL